jgi:hypothetical protein
MFDSVFWVRGPAHVLIKGGLIDFNSTQNVPPGNGKKGSIKSR